LIVCYLWTWAAIIPQESPAIHCFGVPGRGEIYNRGWLQSAILPPMREKCLGIQKDQTGIRLT